LAVLIPDLKLTLGGLKMAEALRGWFLSWAG